MHHLRTSSLCRRVSQEFLIIRGRHGTVGGKDMGCSRVMEGLGVPLVRLRPLLMGMAVDAIISQSLSLAVLRIWHVQGIPD